MIGIGGKITETEVDEDEDGNEVLGDTTQRDIELSDLTDALFSGVANAIINSPGSPESYSLKYNTTTTTNAETGEIETEVTGYTETLYLGGYGDAVELRRVTTYGSDSDSVTYQLMQHYAMWIYEGYNMDAVYEDPPPPVPQGSQPMSITSPEYYEYVVKQLRLGDFNPLTIHHGTHANQRTNFLTRYFICRFWIIKAIQQRRRC